MSKPSEVQGVKEQAKTKRGCVENSAAKSCKMCKVCGRNKAKYTNVQIENK
ncbi:hypothetical protein BACCIP111899_04061 [Bacillus rhizoplanae]|uniref:Uncharacterized protein n=1 Tax=Bacillus rhizoplanae TaxID=2880966 RepID=A0ABM8YG67_9BACI|nr:hypothetical protein [Bacillus rhizoplanae]CAG9614828.1 hypothetical protein BACCIP111899_04061 [Bacillus rhizoplanae]